MPEIIQAIRGMHDILPSESPLWQNAEAKFRNLFQQFGLKEIRFPIVEKTELFKRSIGDITDIVEKEMYTFIDRNQDSLSLRPEGTASCVRAGIEHGLLYNQIQRLWYGGAFFRHERPQKGRCRQFHQYSAEIFGLAGPDIDAELILLSAQLLESIGIKPYISLQINSLGTVAARAEYRKKLIHYLEMQHASLDEDSANRLHKNPMRILDSKNPVMQEIIKQAPKLLEHLDEESLKHFETLQKYLHSVNIEFTVNPFLVRGLDYYTKTVFEWVTNHLGAQGTVCSGGRYDGLVEQLGGKATPAVGFSVGMERVILLMQEVDKKPAEENSPDVYIMSDSDDCFARALQLSVKLREKLPQLRILLHCGGGSLKNQFKKADKTGAQYAIVIGDAELSKDVVAIKNLRENIPQQEMNESELLKFFKSKI